MAYAPRAAGRRASAPETARAGAITRGTGAVAVIENPKTIVRCSPLPLIVSMLGDGRLQDANDAALAMLGRSHSDCVGRTPEQLGMWTAAEQARFVRLCFSQDAGFKDVELRMRRGDGGHADVLATGNAVDMDGQQFLIVQFCSIDVRKRLEDELWRSRESFRIIFQNGPKPCYMTTLDDGTLREANDAWLSLYGYRTDEVIGHTGDELCLWAEPGQRADLVARLRESGSLKSVECRHVCKDGSEIDVLLSAEAIEIGGEILLLWQEVEITERKRFERAIQRLNEELERRVAQRTLDLSEVNRELESFSYSVAHDLRAPLRAIDGFANLLRQEHAQMLDEAGRHYLAKVQNNVARMAKLIDDLLAFARVGRAELDIELVEVKHMTWEVVGELAPSYPGTLIEVSDLPAVQANASLLRQVIHNLVSNAFKFSGRHGAAKIRIGASVRDGNAVFYVQDNGVGFDMRYAHKLFGVFQRLHSVKDFEGTGVGLAIAGRIMQRHGGRIWAEAEVGKGATFHFQLPLEGGSIGAIGGTK